MQHFGVLIVASIFAACEGPPGPPGAAGLRGAQGPQGLSGIIGAVGPQGESGQSVTAAPIAEGEYLCPNGGTEFVRDDGFRVGLACNGAPGAVGPQGPQGIISAARGQGPSGVPVFATLSAPGWVSPTAEVTVTAGQKVLVNATATLGSTALGGAAGLRLFVCYRNVFTSASSPAQPAPPGMGAEGLQVAQNTRHTFSLSNVLTGIEGTYQVGLCGSVFFDSVRQPLPAGNWNSPDYGSVSAVVMN
jgi:hypothetical protein